MDSKQAEPATAPSSVAQAALSSGSSTGVETMERLGVHGVSEKKNSYTREREVDEGDDIRYVPDDVESLHIGKGMTASEKVDNMEEIALYALHVEDNRSLNPWTFRMWFLGKSS
jgi:hypothetical protein